jgi:hypothetical protein
MRGIVTPLAGVETSIRVRVALSGTSVRMRPLNIVAKMLSQRNRPGLRRAWTTATISNEMG